MKLDEAEQKIFCEIQQEFVDEYGEGALFAVYRMHRQFSNKLGFKNFPTKEVRDNLLYNILESDRFNGVSLHQVFLALEKEIGIRESTFYSFYHNYFIPRKKEERKQIRRLYFLK
ncbi:MAG: hypothetical protein RDU14_16660 [Melioribacteraceae bacterium]|nr:hypothetical protein [Melioribacteraceae bacterium]